MSLPELPHNVEAPTDSEHYAILIEDARALGDRRETINNLFVGLVTLILGAQGYIITSASDTELKGTVIIVALSIFGFIICQVWRNVLFSYRILLNFRYEVLKTWETHFPPGQRYYLAEDIIYEHNPQEDPERPLANRYLKTLKTSHGKTYPFVDIYRVIPSIMLSGFVVIGLGQITFYGLPLVVAQYHWW